MAEIYTFQLRGDTSANWALKNPVLEVRELVLETDTGLMKLGDGVKNYGNLPYHVLSKADKDRIAALPSNTNSEITNLKNGSALADKSIAYEKLNDTLRSKVDAVASGQPGTVTLTADKVLTAGDAGYTFIYEGASTITITSDHIPFSAICDGTGAIKLSLTGAVGSPINKVTRVSGTETPGLVEVLVDQNNAYKFSLKNAGAVHEANTNTLEGYFGTRLLEHFMMSDAVVTGGRIDSVTGLRGNVLLPKTGLTKPQLVGGYAKALATEAFFTADIAALSVNVITMVVKAKGLGAGDDSNRITVGGDSNNTSSAPYRGFRMKSGTTPALVMNNSLGAFKTNEVATTVAAGQVYSLIGTFHDINAIYGRYKVPTVAEILADTTSADRASSPSSRLLVGSNHTSGAFAYEIAEVIFINGALDVNGNDKAFLDTYLAVS